MLQLVGSRWCLVEGEVSIEFSNNDSGCVCVCGGKGYVDCGDERWVNVVGWHVNVYYYTKFCL